MSRIHQIFLIGNIYRLTEDPLLQKLIRIIQFLNMPLFYWLVLLVLYTNGGLQFYIYASKHGSKSAR
jgi:hypothetical protein